MVTSLLKTKLFIPRAHPSLVPRARLVDTIETGIQKGHSVTLVAAPAGFGKTTAVSTWVGAIERPVAWLSLDDGDNEDMLFWAYVIAAIQSVFPEFGAEMLSALMSTPPAPVQDVLPDLINEIAALPAALTLVLDDYHVINNTHIHEGLAFLIDHQPHTLHIIIATRADPPVPLARLRARRMLTELRVDELRFLNQEAQIFLNQVMALGLSAEDVELLEARTEGWSVGLLLAAQSMQGREDKHAFIAAFSGSQHYILEYLIEEVLEQQLMERRAFLLQTAIFDRLSGQLCDAVLETQDSGQMLREISKDNLFLIPLDQDHIWYRYHHLFSDLLVNMLYKEFAEGEILALHQRASCWYEDAGEMDKAVRFALKGKDFARAADLLECIVERMIARGQVKTLLGWLGALPADVIQSRPRLLMHQGWVVFLSGKVRQSSLILLSAKEALDAVPEGEERNLLHGRLSAMLATITSLTRDLPAAAAEAEEALAVLPEDAWVFHARARRVLGVCAGFQGDFDEALAHLEQAKVLALQGSNLFLASEILSQMVTIRKHQGKLSLAWQTCQDILDLYDPPEKAPSACLGYISMAVIALERNELSEAQRCLGKGIELCQKGSIGYALQPAYLIGGLLAYACGDEETALKTIQKGEALSRLGGGSLESILGLAWFQTRLYLQLGNVEAARAWAEGEMLPGDWSFEAMPVVLDEMHQDLLARVFLTANAHERVLDICEQIIPQAETGGRLARVIEMKLFQAVALQGMGQEQKAQEAFGSCLALAESEGYVRLFVETGEMVKPLLQEERKGNHKVYAEKILAAFGSGPVKAPVMQDGLAEPLTGRELDVLHLMCRGYSNQHIADELIVSVNTVKKHTSNIYGKLGVKNRAQAVLRAREMGVV